MKKFLSLLLCVTMLMSMMAYTAIGEEIVVDTVVETAVPDAPVVEAAAPAVETEEPAAQVEEPVVEEPVVEVTEAPVVEAEEPVVEVTEAPVVEAEEPVVEVTEVPVVETEEPVVEVTEAPVVEVTEEPVVETEEPVVEVTEEPVVETEEPAVETEEPAVEETEEPAVETEEPAVEETEEPVVETEEPAVEETEEPAVETEEPAVEETEEPAVETEEPAVEETEEPVDPELAVDPAEDGFVIVDGVLTAYTGSATVVNIPNTVTAIGDHALAGSKTISAVIIPTTVKTIGDGAFANCSVLRSVTFTSGSVCTSLGDSAFENCALTSVTLPASMKKIGVRCFAGCYGLETLNLSNNLTNISDSAFLNCKGLATVTIPSGVTVIGASAFKGCDKLESVKIPTTVTTIGSDAFASCITLDNVIIPEGVKTIGHYAFGDCSSMTKITLPNSVTSIGVDAFKNPGTNFRASVPPSSTALDYCDTNGVPYSVALVLGTPTINLTSTVDASTIKLGWTTVTGANGYRVYRSNKADGAYVLVGTVTSGTQFTDETALRGMNFYRVSAIYTYGSYLGEGKQSDPKGAAGLDKGVLETVKGNSATGVTLTWSSIENATHYQILRATTESGPYTGVNTVTGNTYKNTGVTAGSTYYYKVCPMIQVDGVRYYGPVSDAKSIHLVDAPIITSAEQLSATSIKLNWDAVTGAVKYEVYMAVGDSATFAKLTPDATTNSYTVTGLEDGKSYAFKVKTVYSDATSDFSEVKLVSLMGTPTINICGQSGVRDAQLTWFKVEDVDGYGVFRATTSGGPYTNVKIVTTTSAINYALTPGTTYYYKVAAFRWVDGKRVYGPMSAEKSFTVLKTPTLNKAYQSFANSVTLKWTVVAHADGYGVYRSTSEKGPWTLVKLLESGSTDTCQNLAVTPGQTFYYQVKAYSKVNGNRVYTSPSETKKVTMMGVPSIGNALDVYSTGNATAYLRWTAVTNVNVEGYKVIRSENPTTGYVFINTFAGTTASNVSLNPTKTYYYRVAAYKTIEGSQVLSAYSDPIRVDPKKIEPVTGLQSTHPYANKLKKNYSYSIPGASSLKLKFSVSTYFENGYDKLSIYDGSGKLVGTYTGAQLSGKEVTVSGSSVRLYLVTDSKTTEYGFKVDSVTPIP